jgi:hypothetical protein
VGYFPTTQIITNDSLQHYNILLNINTAAKDVKDLMVVVGYRKPIIEVKHEEPSMASKIKRWFHKLFGRKEQL